MGVQVIGMSLDDVASQAKFAKAQSLNFPLLSDPDGSAAGRLGVLMKDKPYTNRYTIVLDDKGVVRLVDTEVKVGSHGKDLVEAIKKVKG
jgi:peroxiredoxin Q/BCP